MLTGFGVWVLLVFVVGHGSNPTYPAKCLLNESALAEARALPDIPELFLKVNYFTVTVLVATSLPPTNTVTLCEPFGAATT